MENLWFCQCYDASPTKKAESLCFLGKTAHPKQLWDKPKARLCAAFRDFDSKRIWATDVFSGGEETNILLKSGCEKDTENEHDKRNDEKNDVFGPGILLKDTILADLWFAAP